MITDVFYKRYPNDKFPVRQQDLAFFQRVHRILSDTLDGSTKFSDHDKETIWRRAHDALAMEIGWPSLVRTASPYERNLNGLMMCRHFLIGVEPIINDPNYVKHRISLIELVFANIESIKGDWIAQVNKQPTPRHYDEERAQSHLIFIRQYVEEFLVLCDQAVEELNHRLRETYTEVPLEYHNGKIQHASDFFVAEEISMPFWSLLRESKWKNPDDDMKKALDHRDNNRLTEAIRAAAQALESVIKIISDEKGWTRGTEKGAAHYIDNLVVERNGKRFIEVWEKDRLGTFFKSRNDVSHGPGSAPPPSYSVAEADSLIEEAMIRMKSLVRRI
ncbi:MAG: hypothetical protein P4L90_08445 [Rhodopila sp.]|nr:hypothetical protein [Rhodopila sp.]